MATSIDVRGAKLLQTADVRGGEPPNYVLQLKKAVTVDADSGAPIKTREIQLNGADFYSADLGALVGKRVALTGELKLEAQAHHFPGFDFSPARDVVDADVSADEVKALTGKDILTPAFDPM